MVFVVQHIHKIGVEWMDVLKENNISSNPPNQGNCGKFDVSEEINRFLKVTLRNLDLRQAWGSR